VQKNCFSDVVSSTTWTGLRLNSAVRGDTPAIAPDPWHGFA